MKKIEDLKKGEFFRLKENGTVYVRSEYNRSIKKYECYKFDDVCAFREFKKGKLVIVDFEF